VVGWTGGSATVPPTHLLFVISLGLAVSVFAIALAMRPTRDQPAHANDGEVLPVHMLVRVPGLGAILLASVMGVTAGDLIVIYLPLLGAERGIDVAAIGFLLTVRAVATLISRALYARLVTEIGRWRLMVGSTFAAGLGCACLALPLPFWAMGVAMTIIGFALGISTTLSITMVFDLAAASARGTVNSLRIMGNRVGQLLLPFTVGLVAAATGVAGILFIIAASLGASALAVQMTKQGR
jgi:MFS family permease